MIKYKEGDIVYYYDDYGEILKGHIDSVYNSKLGLYVIKNTDIGWFGFVDESYMSYDKNNVYNRVIIELGKNLYTSIGVGELVIANKFIKRFNKFKKEYERI